MKDYEQQKALADELAEALFEEVFVGDLHPMSILDCLDDCGLRLMRVETPAENPQPQCPRCGRGPG